MSRVLVCDGSRIGGSTLSAVPHVHSGSMVFFDEATAKASSPEMRKEIAKSLVSVSTTLTLGEQKAKACDVDQLDSLIRG